LIWASAGFLGIGFLLRAQFSGQGAPGAARSSRNGRGSRLPEILQQIRRLGNSQKPMSLAAFCAQMHKSIARFTPPAGQTAGSFQSRAQGLVLGGFSACAF
jgi:hypothetical protein